MWYLVVNVVLAVWMAFDASKRRAGVWQWALWTLAFGVIVVPVWLAKRPLLDGEVREGGIAWNLLKTFALIWTLFMLVAAFGGIANVASSVSPTASELEAGATAVGAVIGLGLLAVL